MKKITLTDYKRVVRAKKANSERAVAVTDALILQIKGLKKALRYSKWEVGQLEEKVDGLKRQVAHLTPPVIEEEKK